MICGRTKRSITPDVWELFNGLNCSIEVAFRAKSCSIGSKKMLSPVDIGRYQLMPSDFTKYIDRLFDQVD